MRRLLAAVAAIVLVLPAAAEAAVSAAQAHEARAQLIAQSRAVEAANGELDLKGPRSEEHTSELQSH